MPDLSTPASRLLFVGAIAIRFGLEPALVAAVCEQESSWNPWAVRFEFAFLQHYVKPQNPIAPTTMELTRACSFGLMQVMGEVAMELGWRGYFLTELCDPETGVTYGCKKLQKAMDRHGRDVELALLDYNGGGNANYAAEVLARLPHYQQLAGQK